jgi:hypothetical protein
MNDIAGAFPKGNLWTKVKTAIDLTFRVIWPIFGYTDQSSFRIEVREHIAKASNIMTKYKNIHI